MDKHSFEKLVQSGENEQVDFKESYHKNKASLVHDILCMSNSKADGSRYILFGG